MAESHLKIAESSLRGVACADSAATVDPAGAELLAMVSHELRNPATAMIMTAQTLAEGRLGELAPAQRAAAERIAATGRHLIDLIGDYLDLVRLEGGEPAPRMRWVANFNGEVVASAVEITAAAVAEAGMHLLQRTPAELGGVYCDPDLMRIVLVNLLGNAAKYGRDEGQIRLSIYRLPQRLEISVYNDGPGFPASETHRLFEKFTRLDDPALRRRRGSGLGLYTCRRIVALHDGSISTTSEHGRWAEFTVSLPVQD